MQRDWGSSRVSCGVLVVEGGNKVGLSYGDPQDVVRVNGVAGATDVLLVTGRVDDDGVLRGAWSHQRAHRATEIVGDIPRRLASRGLMSKMSTPCIFPRISRRSRPVDCSASVGTVPGLAPSGMRSSMDLISVVGISSWPCRRRSVMGCHRSSGAKSWRAHHVRSSFL